MFPPRRAEAGGRDSGRAGSRRHRGRGRTAPQAAAAPLGVLLDYAAGVISASDLRASGAARCHPVRIGPTPRRAVDVGQADPAARGPRPLSERPQDRVLLPVRQAGHRGLARRAGRRGAARQTRLAAARGRRWLLRCTDLRLDRRRSQPRAVQTAGRTVSARVGSRCSATSAWGSTRTPRPSTGPCRTVSARTSGSTTGGRRRATRTPLRTCTRCEIDKRSVGGVGVDLNAILQPRFGQWD